MNIYEKTRLFVVSILIPLAGLGIFVGIAFANKKLDEYEAKQMILRIEESIQKKKEEYKKTDMARNEAIEAVEVFNSTAKEKQAEADLLLSKMEKTKQEADLLRLELSRIKNEAAPSDIQKSDAVGVPRLGESD